MHCGCIAHVAHANHAKNKRYCKSRVYMKHHPNGKLKNVMVFSALGNFSSPTVYQKQPKQTLCSKLCHFDKNARIVKPNEIISKTGIVNDVYKTFTYHWELTCSAILTKYIGINSKAVGNCCKICKTIKIELKTGRSKTNEMIKNSLKQSELEGER